MFCISRIVSVLSRIYLVCSIFFFQAADGIRVTSVTGVQTCSLPISSPAVGATTVFRAHLHVGRGGVRLELGAPQADVVPARARHGLRGRRSPGPGGGKGE